MEEHDSTSDDGTKPTLGRRQWETPRLIEYGSVAKLTQSGGSTQSEAGVPAEMKKCL
jgi:hypothetical protein